MDRRTYLNRIGAGLTIGVSGMAGCGAPGDEDGTEVDGEEGQDEGEDETPTEEGEETEEEAGGGNQDIPSEIAMVTEDEEYYFDPIGLYVEPGETITWINEAGSHSSTAYTEENPQSEVRRIPDDAEGWNSETISEEGGEFEHTFEVEGTYDYYCIPHKSLEMVGRVVVGEPSGLEGDPPDGPVPDEQTIVDQGSVAYDEFESD